MTRASFARIEFNGFDVWVDAATVRAARTVDELADALAEICPPAPAGFFEALVSFGKYSFFV